MTGELRTKRLRLERLRADHADQVFEAMQDPALYTFVPQDPPEREALRARYAFLAGASSPDGRERWLNWIAFLEASATAVGHFQATVPPEAEASIAYSVFPSFWRRGYAREMGLAVVEHLFEDGRCPGLFAEIDTRNEASLALVAALGFRRESRIEGADFFKGASSDEYRCALSREEWLRAGSGEPG